MSAEGTIAIIAGPAALLGFGLYPALAPYSRSHAFAAVEYVQMGILTLPVIDATALPRLTKASADDLVIDGWAPPGSANST